MNKLFVALLSLGLTSLAFAEDNIRLSGKIAVEITSFSEEGKFSDQNYQTSGSIAAEPELYWESANGDHTLNFIPFFRLDARDDERTHGDIRELLWSYINGNWEVRSGVGKVFWGVTEFNHLVDIINQTDGVESFDGEDKLGQPMINVSHVADWGIIDGFILPGFRERTFPGEDGRFRFDPAVSVDDAEYESDDEERHIDFALRWSHSIGVYDLGVYGFSGTDRNPIFQFSDGELIPYYQQIDQLGVDVQATVDSWLLKLEGIYQSSNTDDFGAAQAGFEYTLYGIFSSAADMGLLAEYGWDSRGDEAGSAAQNDIYLGARVTFNNTQDSALLVGTSYDNDFNSKTLLVEASTRLNDYWTVAVDGVLFETEEDDPAHAFEQDDRLQLTLERFF